MLNLSYLKFKSFPWVYWLDPLSHINQNFDQNTFKKIEFDKIKLNLQRSNIVKKLSIEMLCKRKFIREIFERDSNGINYVGLNTKLTDNLIVKLFNYLKTANGKKDYNELTILALGGYGRGELAPKSDVDLLFLVKDKSFSGDKFCDTEKLIQEFLYFLWDLGFSVGHSTRTVNEIFDYAKKDITFLTSLIDHRFLIGNKKAYESFNKFFLTFNKKYNTLDFIKKKINGS